MRSWQKWCRLLLAATIAPLLGYGCSTPLRDAVLSGVMDFVSGTTAEILSALLPVDELLQGV